MSTAGTTIAGSVLAGSCMTTRMVQTGTSTLRSRPLYAYRGVYFAV